MEPQLDLEPVDLPAEKAAPLALIVNEVVTNALKHAFVRMDGDARLRVVLRVDGEALRVEVLDNGAGIAPDERPANFGMKLMRSLARQLQAEISWENNQPGTRVRLELPSSRAAQGVHE